MDDDKNIIEKTIEAVKDIAHTASEAAKHAMEPEPTKPGEEVAETANEQMLIGDAAIAPEAAPIVVAAEEPPVPANKARKRVPRAKKAFAKKAIAKQPPTKSKKRAVKKTTKKVAKKAAKKTVKKMPKKSVKKPVKKKKKAKR
jgi:hypothetical protein